MRLIRGQNVPVNQSRTNKNAHPTRTVALVAPIPRWVDDNSGELGLANDGRWALSLLDDLAVFLPAFFTGGFFLGIPDGRVRFIDGDFALAELFNNRGRCLRDDLFDAENSLSANIRCLGDLVQGI